MKSNIEVSTPRLSTIIALSCTAPSPELAHKIVAAWADVYTKEHVRLNRTAGSEEFFRQQAELSSAQLKATTQKLVDLKNANTVATTLGQFELIESQKATITAEEHRIARELADSQAKYNSLKKSVDVLKPMVLSQRVDGVAN